MLTTEEAVLQHFGGDPLWANESDIRDGRYLYSFRGGATSAQARETRRLARQVLRLTRVQTGDLSSADVGDDTA